MFSHRIRILFRDCDAAGVLFFGRYFSLAHDAYEAFLASNGLNMGELLRAGRYVIPIVHAESDYRKPLPVGEEVAINVRVAEVRRRAFTMAYEFRNKDGDVTCALKTVHVPVDLKTSRAIPIPEDLARALERESDETAH